MKKVYLFSFLLLLLQCAGFSQSYYFTGNGLWSVPANWYNNAVPPSPLPGGGNIYIAPAAGDSCVLNVSQTISQGGSLIISTGANFIIAGGVVINNISSQPSTTICNQVWMSKNLAVSAYRNGDFIPEVTDGSVWNSLTTGAWCWINNDSVNYSKYGKLYNWYAVNDPRGLAPQGWRIPDSLDVDAMIRCYGNQYAGGALKETGTSNWQNPNAGATNIFGFAALPGGWRRFGGFDNLGYYGYFWESQQTNDIYDYGNHFMLFYSSAFIMQTASPKKEGASVRCLKDTVVSASNFPTLTTSAIANITANSAVSGGTILSDGGYPVIEKGVVWDTLPNPDFSDTKTIDGNTPGDYTSNMALLSVSRTYYVRAYARNQLGIGYGNEISFTTAPVLLPSVSTLPVRFFKDTLAYGVCKMIDLGGGVISEMGVVISTSPDPTLADKRAATFVNYYDSVAVRCGSLLPSTVYYIKAYDVNEAGVSFGEEISFTTAAPSPGNVIISNQVWMAKNLDVSSYRNGDPIPQVTDAAAWGSLTTGAWCWYNNDSATYAATYGKLYNWYAVNDPRGLAPEGWHVPTNNEWLVLDTVFGNSFAAGAIKEAGTAHWQVPNIGATNISGFTALPNGIRSPNGNLSAGIGIYAYWWGAESDSETTADLHSAYYAYQFMSPSSSSNKKYGAGVRCIKNSQ